MARSKERSCVGSFLTGLTVFGFFTLIGAAAYYGNITGNAGGRIEGGETEALGPDDMPSSAEVLTDILPVDVGGVDLMLLVSPYNLTGPFNSADETPAITQGYHGRDCGIDIAAARGTPISSPISGTVVYAGFLPPEGDLYDGTSVIKIQNPVFTARLVHMDIAVQVGSMVKAGDVIGYESNHGYTMNMNGELCNGVQECGNHLHFELTMTQSGICVHTLGGSIIRLHDDPKYLGSAGITFDWQPQSFQSQDDVPTIPNSTALGNEFRYAFCPESFGYGVHAECEFGDEQLVKSGESISVHEMADQRVIGWEIASKDAVVEVSVTCYTPNSPDPTLIYQKLALAVIREYGIVPFDYSCIEGTKFESIDFVSSTGAPISVVPLRKISWSTGK